MKVQKKVKFDAAAAAARAAAEADKLPERQYFREVEADPAPSQYSLLPEEYQEVCIEGALPLEYVGADWLLIVVTSHWNYESAFVMGEQLHAKWEDTRLDHMALDTVRKMRGGYLPIACPNGSYLAAKILGVYE